MTPGKVYGTSKLEEKIMEISWNSFLKMRQFNKETVKMLKLFTEKWAGLSIIYIYIYTDTRISRCFAPIIYFNCEHFLFVRKIKTSKKFADLFEKFLGWRLNFEILIIHKIRVRTSRVDVYWLKKKQ